MGIEFDNILIDTYKVIETDIGNNYGYILEDKYVTWEATTSGSGMEATVTVKRESSNNTKNAKKLIFLCWHLYAIGW